MRHATVLKKKDVRSQMQIEMWKLRAKLNGWKLNSEAAQNDCQIPLLRDCIAAKTGGRRRLVNGRDDGGNFCVFGEKPHGVFNLATKGRGAEALKLSEQKL